MRLQVKGCHRPILALLRKTLLLIMLCRDWLEIQWPSRKSCNMAEATKFPRYRTFVTWLEIRASNSVVLRRDS